MGPPSVILLHARYKSDTAAVSKMVATKLPSIFAFAPLQITYGQRLEREIETGFIVDLVQ